jgi:hypothetical protein
MKLALEVNRSGNGLLQFEEWEHGMALVLKGGEFITTEALSAGTLSRLMTLAQRRPLLVNGLELHHLDLAKLVEEAQKTGQPVWPDRQIAALVES